METRCPRVGLCCGTMKVGWALVARDYYGRPDFTEWSGRRVCPDHRPYYGYTMVRVLKCDACGHSEKIEEVYYDVCTKLDA